MPLQNRVDPFGRIHAVTARGTMMGNRGGKFHRDDQTLGRRRWASWHWICCDLHYKNTHHDAMGEGYTSLFFLDEVTALAAGHRPCFFCRHAQARQFMSLMPWPMKVDEADRIVHAQRLASSPLPFGGEEEARRRRRWEGEGRGYAGKHEHDPHLTIAETRWGLSSPYQGEVGVLPTGTMIALDAQPYAIRGPHLFPWSFTGYGSPIPRISITRARLLTPPLYVGILAKGYQPRWHESAHEGET